VREPHGAFSEIRLVLDDMVAVGDRVGVVGQDQKASQARTSPG